MVLLWVFYQYQGNNKSTAQVQKADSFFSDTETQKSNEQKQNVSQQKTIVIDIKGAVQKPGIYHVQDTDRVIDAIEQAGGFTEHADRDKINLAQKLTDELVIYVPKKGEKESSAFLTSASSEIADQQTGNDKINVNTADEQTLQNLPGIGPAKAKAIIQYREEHGPFKNADELTNVTGIGDKSLERMKPNLQLQ
ncbi:helix-hairpin-helix domain-containing protein [Sporolactobacillus sp. CPB3-1]|uniref:Helix-hairpin-helix domain-containing protein n=1 Tax=Sporolactobacillus mangiferae TaxID=2940498 RepID=A0ABT0M6D5_9BACL|nr:helix-hairpin-helix domain-containing protein [Sporolactobacillus mangiferae]MCL1630437.1 helix-hairpin-helix domain-containing protein [Sporolactobacillus mangiferae]